MWRINGTTRRDIADRAVRTADPVRSPEALKSLGLSDRQIEKLFSLIKIANENPRARSIRGGSNTTVDDVFWAAKQMFGGATRTLTANNGHQALALDVGSEALIFDYNKRIFMAGTEQDWRNVYDPPPPPPPPRRRSPRHAPLLRSPSPPDMDDYTRQWVHGGDRGTAVNRTEFSSMSELRSAAEKANFFKLDNDAGTYTLWVGEEKDSDEWRFFEFSTLREVLLFLDKKPTWYGKKSIAWLTELPTRLTSEWLTQKYREALGKSEAYYPSWKSLLENKLRRRAVR